MSINDVSNVERNNDSGLCIACRNAHARNSSAGPPNDGEQRERLSHAALSNNNRQCGHKSKRRSAAIVSRIRRTYEISVQASRRGAFPTLLVDSFPSPLHSGRKRSRRHAVGDALILGPKDTTKEGYEHTADWLLMQH